MPLVKQRVYAAMREANFAGPTALAERAGVSPSTIHRLGRRGGAPDMRTMEAIARVTGRDIDWLLGRDRPPEPDLATALAALTEELREWRRERAEVEGRLQGLEEGVKLLFELAGAVLPGRSVPDGTKG